MLRTFTGYRGVAALLQIGDVKFMVVARDTEQLSRIYPTIVPEAQKTVVISAKTLPEPKST